MGATLWRMRVLAIIADLELGGIGDLVQQLGKLSVGIGVVGGLGLLWAVKRLTLGRPAGF